MSDALLFAGCFLACWLAAGAAVVVLINRARRKRPYLAARLDEKTGAWANEDEHDVGPDALRLLKDLDTHLDEYVAADTELAAGFDRLRRAVRDEQQKGEL